MYMHTQLVIWLVPSLSGTGVYSKPHRRQPHIESIHLTPEAFNTFETDFPRWKSGSERERERPGEPEISKKEKKKRERNTERKEKSTQK